MERPAGSCLTCWRPMEEHPIYGAGVQRPDGTWGSGLVTCEAFADGEWGEEDGEVPVENTVFGPRPETQAHLAQVVPDLPPCTCDVDSRTCKRGPLAAHPGFGIGI